MELPGTLILQAFKLEIRKQRRLFLQCLLFPVLLFVVFGGILLSSDGRPGLNESLDVLFFFIAACAMIIFPILFGASAGRRLQLEPERSSEEALPLSAGSRLLAAYSAGLLFAILSTLFPLLPLVPLALKSDTHLQDWSILLMFLSQVQVLMTLSFVLGYLRRHLFLAMVLVPLLAILEFVLSFFVFLISEPMDTFFFVATFASTAVTVATGLLLLALLTRKLEL